MQNLTKCRNIYSKDFLTEQGNPTVLLQLVDNLGIILTDNFKKNPGGESPLSLLSLWFYMKKLQVCSEVYEEWGWMFHLLQIIHVAVSNRIIFFINEFEQGSKIARTQWEILCTPVLSISFQSFLSQCDFLFKGEILITSFY